MFKAYLFPISARASRKVTNPYIENFINSLEDNFKFLNKNMPSQTGVFDVFRYINEVDYIFFHWPENIAERKQGIIQTLVLFFIIIIARLKGINIAYVVHNKISHSKKRHKTKRFIARMMAAKSRLLITHAGEGIDFIKSLTQKNKKVFFFPHPIDASGPSRKEKKDIDVLVWGNIAPYKGVHNFLARLKNQETQWNGTVLIAGKVSSPDYYQELISVKPGNVTILDDFIDDDKLHTLINRSRIVLFPYHRKSILSSGAFAKTLAYPVHIIGPACGAFLDFKELKHIHTFETQNQIYDKIREILSENYHEPDPEIIKKLKVDYSWISFGKALKSYLNK